MIRRFGLDKNSPGRRAIDQENRRKGKVKFEGLKRYSEKFLTIGRFSKFGVIE